MEECVEKKHFWSDKGFKGTVANWALVPLHRGSIKITLRHLVNTNQSGATNKLLANQRLEKFKSAVFHKLNITWSLQIIHIYSLGVKD